MYCPHCTAWNDDNATTCGYCHRDLTMNALAPASPPPSPSPPAPRGAPMPPPPAQARPPYGIPAGATPSSPGLSAPGYGPRPSPKASVKATWSLALGLIGMLCFCVGALAGIPGLVLGIFAYRECTSAPERFTGRGFAIAGIVTSIIAIVISLGMGLYYGSKMDELWTEVQQELGAASGQTGMPGSIAGESPSSSYASDAVIMVQIIPAIESYFVDHQAWPAWAAGPRGANRHVPAYDPAYAMPTFRVWSGPAELGRFATLTTPVAFLMNYPDDPYAAVVSGAATFGYYTNDHGWIVYSPGPDGVYDLDPLTMYPHGEWDDAAYLNLFALKYDPTNGATSRGDIIYMMEESGD